MLSGVGSFKPVPIRQLADGKTTKAKRRERSAESKTQNLKPET